MGYTNLQVSLLFAYRRWLGEKEVLEKQVKQIEQAHLTLDEKRDRVAQCARLIASVDTIMNEVSNDWDPSSITPAQTHGRSTVFENGEITRLTLDVLRRSTAPMRAIHISRQIVKELEMDVTDKVFVHSVNKGVDGTLRSMKKRNVIGKTDEEPCRWYIMGRDDHASS